jgi:hypothetical protein
VRPKLPETVHQAIARILSDAALLEEAPAKLLEVIAAANAFCVGFLWQIDRRTGILGCTADWSHAEAGVVRFQSVSRAEAFPLGQGLPGGVFRSGAPVWLSDFSSQSHTFRWDVAARDGIRSGVALPIRLARETVGACELCSGDTWGFGQRLMCRLASR